MFTIDNALQIHWHSCLSAPNRSSVNDNILRMTDIQDSIIRLNFNQMLPKIVSNRVLAQNRLNNDVKYKGLGKGKHIGKRIPKGNQDRQDLIYNNDKSHLHWHLKENENFAKVFYKNQKECPRTSEGKLICMKFFLYGIYTKLCSRSHALSTKDSKNIEAFIHDCRAGAAKPDF